MCMYECMHVCAYLCMYVSMHAYISCMYCMHVYVCMYVPYIHVHVHCTYMIYSCIQLKFYKIKLFINYFVRGFGRPGPRSRSATVRISHQITYKLKIKLTLHGSQSTFLWLETKLSPSLHTTSVRNLFLAEWNAISMRLSSTCRSVSLQPSEL